MTRISPAGHERYVRNPDTPLRGRYAMTNKLGIVTTAILSDKKMISKDGEYICAVPEDRQDVREGLIAYLDRTGMLQFMEEDPHDYR